MKRTYKIIYIFFNILTIVILINEVILKNTSNIFICLITLLLYILPSIISKIFKIVLPNHFKIAILFFIFFSQVLGELYNFYISFPYWDNIVHTIFGFYISVFGFNLIYFLNKDKIISSLFIIIFLISFTCLLGVFWELFEYSVDKIFLKDMQKDAIVNKISTSYLSNKKITIKDIDHTIIYNKNNKKLLQIDKGYLDIGIKDTTEDFISNLIGSIIFSIVIYFFPLGEYFIIKKDT